MFGMRPHDGMASDEDTQEEEQVHLVKADWEKTKQWRRQVLIRAGWSYDLAQVVAACADIDLHVAVEMVEAGCSPSLASKILL